MTNPVENPGPRSLLRAITIRLGAAGRVTRAATAGRALRAEDMVEGLARGRGGVGGGSAAGKITRIGFYDTIILVIRAEPPR